MVRSLCRVTVSVAHTSAQNTANATASIDKFRNTPTPPNMLFCFYDLDSIRQGALARGAGQFARIASGGGSAAMPYRLIVLSLYRPAWRITWENLTAPNFPAGCRYCRIDVLTGFLCLRSRRQRTR